MLGAGSDRGVGILHQGVKSNLLAVPWLCTNDDDDDVGGTERIQSPGPKVAAENCA